MDDVREGETFRAETLVTLQAETDNTTLVALQRADIDQSIATAKAYPRNLAECKADMLAMATLDEETAASMFYAIPRDGKTITGESVRLAEIAGSAWRNTRYGARVVEVGEDFLTAQGSCFDLERNVWITLEVRRRITNKHGRRYSNDMIQTTGMAACAIALRNAIFKVVPRAFIKPVLAKAMLVAAGQAKTMKVKRQAALDYFENEHGVKPERVFAALGVQSADEITMTHITHMIGFKTALTEEGTKIDDIFPKPDTSTADGPVSIESLGAAVVEPAEKVEAQESVKTPEPEPEKVDEPAEDEAADEARIKAEFDKAAAEKTKAKKRTEKKQAGGSAAAEAEELFNV